MIFFLIIFFLLALRFHLNRNKYIIGHKSHLNNDKKYNDYLKWCAKVGEAPMDKKIFNKEIEDKNNEIKRLL